MTQSINPMYKVLLTACEIKPDAIPFLLSHCDASIFDIVDNNQKNIFMIACTTYPKALPYLLESDKVTPELIFRKDHYGNTCMHVASKNASNALRYLLESDKVTPDLIAVQNKNNDTCMHYACCFQSRAIVWLLHSDKVTPELIAVQNKSGNTCMHYACVYQPYVVPVLLESDKVTTELLAIQNKYNDTCLDFAYVAISDSVEYLMKSDKVTPELLALHNFDKPKSSLVYNTVSHIVLNSDKYKQANEIKQRNKPIAESPKTRKVRFSIEPIMESPKKQTNNDNFIVEPFETLEIKSPKPTTQSIRDSLESKKREVELAIANVELELEAISESNN